MQNLRSWLALGLALAALAGQAAPGPLPSDAEGFYFLAGDWRVQHRKRADAWAEPAQWKEFEGSASFRTLVDGLLSVEELRDASGKPFGGAVRSFDRERRVWTDSWLGAGDGVLQPGAIGRFDGPEGSFVTADVDGEQLVLARGVWRRISPDEFTWEQFLSRDHGANWRLTWHMRFLRLPAGAAR